MNAVRLAWRHPSAAWTSALVRAGELTNHPFVLPLLIFYATSRCNSRCRSCDWWRATGEGDLSLDEIARVADSLPSLGTRVVVFSGGEPLLRPDVFEAADLFAARGLRLQLLTSGVLLDRRAAAVAARFEQVTISLDATTPALYQTIRGIDALDQVASGIARVKMLDPGVRITARSTLHRLNFRELPRLIVHARRLGVDGISFLAADLASDAFGRATSPGPARDLMLTLEEISEFEQVIERTIAAHRLELESGFVAESPEKLRRIAAHYRAMAGGQSFPPQSCNAPWVSVVLEADGVVRPCFFQKPVGSVRRQPLGAILSDGLPAFRRSLCVATDPVCGRCVCSIRAGWRNAPWR